MTETQIQRMEAALIDAKVARRSLTLLDTVVQRMNEVPDILNGKIDVDLIHITPNVFPFEDLSKIFYYGCLRLQSEQVTKLDKIAVDFGFEDPEDEEYPEAPVVDDGEEDVIYIRELIAKMTNTLDTCGMGEMLKIKAVKQQWSVLQKKLLEII